MTAISSFIHVAAWTHHQSPSPKPQPSFGSLRTLTNSISNSDGPHSPKKAPSIMSQASDMCTSKDAFSLEVPHHIRRMSSQQTLMEEEEFSTSPDPRRGGGSPTPARHPGLDDEVAALSTKLINAINHQTSLDDILAATRLELDRSKERVRELEETNAAQREKLAGDVWVRRSAAEAEKNKLLARIIEEKRQRSEVEKEKRKIEQELENLTTALFEEANNMVISAKEEAQREHDVLQRKNDLLKSQLSDTEDILRSQQEQLAELKLVMEQLTLERDDHSGTTPSSPGFSKFDSRDDDTTASDSGSQGLGLVEPSSPTYPTSLTHLLQPVLRTDIAAYDDFLALIQTSKRAPSRASSGSYTGLNPLLSLAASNASAVSLATSGTTSSNVSPQTPNTPASVFTNPSVPLPPLKETKFYKRALVEDVEPTLRLDMAPGLSWLARRSVLTAITEGTLVVEPVPTNSPFAAISKPQFYPCSLCGDNRRDDPHLRMHRFKTNESDSAQRYPLCKYCLSRVRSTCDFLGFLRIVKDGHWRVDDLDGEKSTWEESVRLREQMFWCRIGGGVVPASQTMHAHSASIDEKPSPGTHETSRAPAEDDSNVKSDVSSDETARVVLKTTDGATEPTVQVDTEAADEPAAESTTEPASESTSEPMVESLVESPVQLVIEPAAETAAEATVNDTAELTVSEEATAEPVEEQQVEASTMPAAAVAHKAAQEESSTSHSTEPLEVQDSDIEKDGVKRLSITIPGASEA
jgi:Rab guanine nucleotide exchange factor SEC2